jgi:hypothetical protein
MGFFRFLPHPGNPKGLLDPVPQFGKTVFLVPTLIPVPLAAHDELARFSQFELRAESLALFFREYATQSWIPAESHLAIHFVDILPTRTRTPGKRKLELGLGDSKGM